MTIESTQQVGGRAQTASTYRRMTNAFIVELRGKGTRRQFKSRGDRRNKPANNMVVLPHLPEMLALGREVDYQRNAIPLAAEPLLVYQKTSPLEFDLNWQYVAGETNKTRLDVIRECALLHSWSLPDGAALTDQNYRPPIDLLVVVGPWIRLRCVLVSITTEMREPWGGDTEEKTVPTFTDEEIERVRNSGPAGAELAQKMQAARQTVPDTRLVSQTELMPTTVDVAARFLATQFYNRELSKVGGGDPSQIVGVSGQTFGTRELRNREYTKLHFYGADSFQVLKGNPG